LSIFKQLNEPEEELNRTDSFKGDAQTDTIVSLSATEEACFSISL